ncbi:carbamoyltransferase C-terminal domain-containing protein [Pararhodobacter zhoushanensis]|uniref:Carbamoyltransferase C-terminal domain-containing protein n=1 Tax=Pararhodobacter zhoushanensis TaxID=2479545 RepID=A0ABT3H585_9RHOB|nr:carbamoyltransferase C-terminal domain-containing protein [Pararhodobacter zhoushanensis]MCW1934970.1 hypothetical protein [Pararhodobacter zhoushanensis]
MALWLKTGEQVTLVRYWEFERYSGQKHHSRSFANPAQALEVIDRLLAEAGVDRSDVRAIFGTPGLPHSDGAWDGADDLNAHTRAHLFGAMLAETDRYFEGDMIGLALDGGPDTVLGKPGLKSPLYAGAVSRKGDARLFSVSSPAPLWSAARHLTGMEEGSLMALGSASRTAYMGSVEDAPSVIAMQDYKAAYEWVQRLHATLSGLDSSAKGTGHTGFDPQFSASENRIAMLMKIIQRVSEAQVCRTVRGILESEGMDPAKTTLAMGGGFALNCRSNSHVMRTFGFADFQALPAVNDGGISLGYGLMYFKARMERFQFSMQSSGHGSLASVETASAPVRTDVILEDLAKGPIVWMEGRAEIGPRALGHRSLLADPRQDTMKDRLNQIKRRQWWRPVAPVILADQVREWFSDADRSPFMLRTFTLRPEKAARVPAISHLDRSARIQTLTREEAPLLYDLLQAFHASTGVPMLCNTSLNDKGEPIINVLEEALIFARRRGLPAVYVDGRRHAVVADAVRDTTVLSERSIAPLFRSAPAEIARLRAEVNPHGLDRNTLAMRQFLPAFEGVDITVRTSAERLRRYAARLARNGVQAWSLMQ